MKKTKAAILLCTAIALAAVCKTTEVKAAEGTDWNYSQQINETDGAFTYHAYLSVDETEAWIHKIEIDKKKTHSTLEIPKKLGNKSVTRIGFTYEAYDNSNSEDDGGAYYKNLFDEFEDIYYGTDGSNQAINGIKKITLPESVEIIQPGTFSGMDYIKEITIPSKVTVIDEEIFYGCDRLQTIQLPAGLKEMHITAFEGCKKLNSLKLSKKNPIYRIKNHCIIEKQSNALIYTLPCKGSLKIPNEIKEIRRYALGSCTSSTVNIPASVIKIEGDAFHKANRRPYNGNKKIKNVTVSKKNKTFAKDGQCIYRKKDKSLAVAIPDDNGKLVLSEKVEKLTDTYSMVNCDTWYKRLEKVVFSKNLKYVEVPAFSQISEAKKVYFMGKKPPKVVRPEGAPEHEAALPIFVDVYVPKDAAKTYKKWYKKYDGYSYVDGFHTFDPKKL